MNNHWTEPELLTPEVANRFALAAMMSSNAYRRDSTRTKFPIEQLGWNRVGVGGRTLDDRHNSYEPKSFLGRIFSNLQFDVWEHHTRPETYFSFKGTDETIDWFNSNFALPISSQHKSAKCHVRKYHRTHPERRIMLTGHSLGGSLALSVSFWLGFDALVFDPSPRLFDGLKNANEPAQRLVVFQDREPLQVVRDHWPKFRSKMNPDDIFSTAFDFKGESLHRIDLLAEGILRMANQQPFEYIAAQVPNKVELG